MRAVLLSSDGGRKLMPMRSGFPLVFAASSTHVAFTESIGTLWSMGSNRKKQIRDSCVKTYGRPVKCDWMDGVAVLDVKCGIDFTAVLDVNSVVTVHGVDMRKITGYTDVRGLSAFKSKFAFIAEGRIIIGEVGKEEMKVIDAPKFPIMIDINDRGMIVRGIDESVFIGRGEDAAERLERVEVVHELNRVRACGESFLVIGEAGVTVIDDNTTRTYRSVEKLVTAVVYGGFVIGLTEFNKLLFSPIVGSELVERKCNAAHMNGLNYALCCALEVTDTGIACCGSAKEGSDKTRDEYIGDTSMAKLYLGEVKSNIDRSCYQGQTGRYIAHNGYIFSSLTCDPADVIDHNLMQGDRVEVDDGEVTYVCTVVGVKRGQIWGTHGNGTYVIPVIPSQQTKVSLLNRDGHTIKSLVLDGSRIYIDTTDSFCAKFGYESGDLVWHVDHGIVEFLGVCAGKLVFLDFSCRKPFMEQVMDFKVLRRASNTLPHTRRVIRIDGTLIDLDVSATGKFMFMPTDRVKSPLGEATVLGWADGLYIQTDEMKMNGYEAVDVDPLDLVLVRRVSGVAHRTFDVDGESMVVSLNTEDGINGFLPGDKVLNGDTYMSVAGFADGKVVLKRDADDQCTTEDVTVETYYRADIQAIRKGDAFGLVMVGSPGLDESMFFPGDIVENAELGVLVFLGCRIQHPVFMSLDAKTVHEMRYSVLIHHNFFDLRKRPAIAGYEVE